VKGAVVAAFTYLHLSLHKTHMRGQGGTNGGVKEKGASSRAIQDLAINYEEDRPINEIGNFIHERSSL
jgi:hypothetical protein